MRVRQHTVHYTTCKVMRSLWCSHYTTWLTDVTRSFTGRIPDESLWNTTTCRHEKTHKKCHSHGRDTKRETGSFVPKIDVLKKESKLFVWWFAANHQKIIRRKKICERNVWMLWLEHVFTKYNPCQKAFFIYGRCPLSATTTSVHVANAKALTTVRVVADDPSPRPSLTPCPALSLALIAKAHQRRIQ